MLGWAVTFVSNVVKVANIFIQVNCEPVANAKAKSSVAEVCHSNCTIYLL
jgi:hypothetical protein